jgi:hypothetical protein
MSLAVRHLSGNREKHRRHYTDVDLKLQEHTLNRELSGSQTMV